MCVKNTFQSSFHRVTIIHPEHPPVSGTFFQSSFHRVGLYMGKVYLANAFSAFNPLFIELIILVFLFFLLAKYSFQSSFHRDYLYRANDLSTVLGFQSSFHRAKVRNPKSQKLQIRIFQSSFHRDIHIS